MPLFNVHRFSNIKPHIAYRFDCDMWVETGDDNESKEMSKFLTFAVKSVSQPAFKLNTDNRKHFGNTQYVIPILKYGETELGITFTETEYMRVYEFLTGLFGGEPYFGMPTKFVHIIIREYDITMQNILTSRHYVTRLKSYDIPEFNNNSYGEPVEISASFYVEYVYPTNATPKLVSKYIDQETGKEETVRTRVDLPQQLTDEDLKQTIAKREEMEKKLALEEEVPKKQFKKSEKIEKRKQEIDTEIQELREKENTAVRLILNVKENSDEQRAEDIRIARQNYAKNLRAQDSEIKNSEEQSIEYYNGLSESEKEAFIIKYAYGIDTSDGIDVEEMKRLQYYATKKGLSDEDMALVENTIVEINNANMTIDSLEKEKRSLEAGVVPTKKPKVELPKDKTVEYKHQLTSGSSTIDIGMEEVEVDGKGVAVTYYDITSSSKQKSSFNEEGVKKVTHASVLELHRDAGNGKVDENTKYKGFVEQGVAVFIDKSGNVSMNIDRILDSHASAVSGSRATNTKTIAIEMSGAVAIAKGSDGKYYERVVTGKKDGKSDIIWREITDAESRGLIEYTSENTSNKTLLENAERNKKTVTALDKGGKTKKVTLTNIYAEKYTDEQIAGLKAAGKAMKQKGVILSSEMTAVSHGGVSGYNEGKTEGIDQYNEMALKALLEGYYSE